MAPLPKVVLVGLGGFIGSVARYALGAGCTGSRAAAFCRTGLWS